MADICGKWRLVSADNVGEYSDAIGCSAESREKALKFLTPENNIVQDIGIQDDVVTIVTTVPGRTIEVKATLGQPIDMTFMDGRELKAVYTVDDGRLREEQSGAFVSSNVRYRDGENMILTMTSGDITTKRVYVKA